MSFLAYTIYAAFRIGRAYYFLLALVLQPTMDTARSIRIACVVPQSINTCALSTFFQSVLGDHLRCVASLACNDANGSQIVNSVAYMRVRRAHGTRPRRRGCNQACAAPRWRNSQTQGLWEFAFVWPALTSVEGSPEFRPCALIVSFRARCPDVDARR